MSKTPRVVIADTSCLILLAKLDLLELLRDLYGTVVVTQQIALEFTLPLPHWIVCQPIHHDERLRLLRLHLDHGEASAIACALEQENALLILDDLPARSAAQALGLTVTGTLGVLVKAKLRGFLPSVKPVIERAREARLRFSEEVLKAVLKQAGEEQDSR